MAELPENLRAYFLENATQEQTAMLGNDYANIITGLATEANLREPAHLQTHYEENFLRILDIPLEEEQDILQIVAPFRHWLEAEGDYLTTEEQALTVREILPILEEFWDKIVTLNTSWKEARHQVKLTTELNNIKQESLRAVAENLETQRTHIAEIIETAMGTLQENMHRTITAALQNQITPLDDKINNMEQHQDGLIKRVVNQEMQKVNECMKIRIQIAEKTLKNEVSAPIHSDITQLRHQINTMPPHVSSEETANQVRRILSQWEENINRKLEPINNHIRTCNTNTDEQLVEAVSDAVSSMALTPIQLQGIHDTIHTSLIPLRGEIHQLSRKIEASTSPATLKQHLKGLLATEQIARSKEVSDIQQTLRNLPTSDELGTLRDQVRQLEANTGPPVTHYGHPTTPLQPPPPPRENPLDHSTPANETVNRLQQQINDLEDRLHNHSSRPTAYDTSGYHTGHEVMTRMPRLTRFEAKTGQNFDVFIARFECMAVRLGWSEEMKLDRLWDSIDGPPANLAAKCRNPSYRRIKATLLDRYSQQKSEHIAALEMDSLSQNPKETLEEFYARVVEIVPYARPNLDAEAIEEELNTRFKNGLSGKDIKWHVWQAKPTNISQSLELAKEARSMLKTIGTKNETQQDLSINQMNVDSSNNDRECYNCHKIGHIAQNCPNKRYPSPNNRYPNTTRYQSPNGMRYGSSPNRSYDRNRPSSSYRTPSPGYGNNYDTSRNDHRGRSRDRNSNNSRPNGSQPDSNYGSRGRDDRWRQNSPSQNRNKENKYYSPSRNPTQDQYNPNRQNSRPNSRERYSENRTGPENAQDLTHNELYEARKLIEAANFLKSSKNNPAKRAPSPKPPISPATTAKCWRCNEPGHVIANCPLQINQTEVSPTPNETNE